MFALALALSSAGAARAAPRTFRNQRVPLPAVRQSTDYTCGPASVLSVMQYYALGNPTEHELAHRMNTSPQTGTTNENVAHELRRSGLAPTLRTNMSLEDLSEQVRAKRPVIVNFQSGSSRQRAHGYDGTFSAGHYAVVVDVTPRHVYLMDPWIGGARGRLTHKDFLSRWHSDDNQDGLKLEGVGIVVNTTRAPVNRMFVERSKPVD